VVFLVVACCLLWLALIGVRPLVMPMTTPLATVGVASKIDKSGE
jgi:hypothetical protein